MPHYYPIVIQSGHSLAGDSLGFHAYSLRIDNLTNQWLLEETSLAWIPPYSLGVCLRLYGTGVAIILNQAPAGQPQPAPLAGEASVGVYSDQLRTEVAGTAVRQFTLIQAVSDLSQGAMPAFPPVGTDRLWADNQGNIHHLHSDGTDYQLVDAHNAQTVLYPVSDPHYQAMMSATALGADLSGTVNNGQVWLRYGSSIDAFDSGGTRHPFESVSGNFHNLYSLGGGFSFLSLAATTVATLNETGTFNNIGNTLSGGSMAAQGSARTDFGVSTPNVTSGLGQHLAFAFTTYASVDHARQYALPIEDVSAPLAKVFSIQGVRYEHVSFDGDAPMRRADGSYLTRPMYGFSARDVYQTLPELVGLDPDTGEPESIDLDRMLVVLWEAFKTYVATTDARLAQLELAA